MRTRRLGRAGLEVSALGLGCMGMTEFYGPGDDARVDRDDPPGARARRHLPRHRRHVRPVHQRAARRPRDRRPARRGRARDEVRQRPRGENGERARRPRRRPSTCAQACDASLRRLGVDHIDLYYQHRVDPRCRSRRPSARMAELVAPGKVRYLGIFRGRGRRRSAARTRCTRSRRCRASSRCGAATSRTRSSPTARELGIGFVPYSPLGRGFLTGQITLDRRPRAPTTSAATSRGSRARTSPRTSSSSSASQSSPAEKGCTPGQLALAWVLAQGDDVVPIPGTKRVAYLEENVGALDVTLSDEDLRAIEQVAPIGMRGRRPLRRHVDGRPLSRRGGADRANPGRRAA